MKRIIETFKDIILNPNIGNFSFWIQRVTGVLLVAYLFLHIYVISHSLQGRDAFDTIISSFESPITSFFEWLLIFVVVLHLLNGIRIVLVDFFALTKAHISILYSMIVLAVVIMAYTLWAFIPKFQH